MNVIELFAGAAGLAQGFERTSKFSALALYDVFEPARLSYLQYRPKAFYQKQDVAKLGQHQVLDVLDGRRLHGILGGPPCQGFSLAGKKDKNNKINDCVLAYARIVDELKPHFLVMENVPQLMFHPLFSPLLESISQCYHVVYGFLNAARYGTPQTRHRLILLAYHKQFGVRPTLPLATHGILGQKIYAYHLSDSDARVALDANTADAVFGADFVIAKQMKRQADNAESAIRADLLPLVTVGEAISDLTDAVSVDDRYIAYPCEARSDYQRLLRGSASNVANCVARQHKGKPLEIVQSLREGGTPEAEGGSRNKRYYSQAYSRLHRAGLARTLTTYFQNAGKATPLIRHVVIYGSTKGRMASINMSDYNEMKRELNLRD